MIKNKTHISLVKETLLTGNNQTFLKSFSVDHLFILFSFSPKETACTQSKREMHISLVSVIIPGANTNTSHRHTPKKGYFLWTSDTTHERPSFWAPFVSAWPTPPWCWWMIQNVILLMARFFCPKIFICFPFLTTVKKKVASQWSEKVPLIR